MSTVTIKEAKIGEMLTNLLGRDVSVSTSDGVTPHRATYRGLVTNEDILVAVVASDLDFAHRSGGALAMIPPGTVNEKGDDPDDDLLMFYVEVANVLSRLIDEATPARVRIDPAMDHEFEAMQTIVSGGSVVAACAAEIEGYGSGAVGVWYLEP